MHACMHNNIVSCLATPTSVGVVEHNIGLISRVVTASIIACISAIAVTTVIAFAVAKRHRKAVTLTHSSGIALSNQVHGDYLIAGGDA